MIKNFKSFKSFTMKDKRVLINYIRDKIMGLIE